MELITAFPIDSIVGVNEEPDSCSSFAGIVQHIKEYGVLHPVLIDKETLTLMAGHARVNACKKLGISTIPAMLDDYHPGSPEAKLIAIEDDFVHKWFNELEQNLRIHKWKQAYLQLHPETKQGVAGANAKHGHANCIVPFAEHAARIIEL